MVDVRNRKCQVEGCTRQPCTFYKFSRAVVPPLLRCVVHSEEGWIRRGGSKGWSDEAIVEAIFSAILSTNFPKAEACTPATAAGPHSPLT